MNPEHVSESPRAALGDDSCVVLNQACRLARKRGDSPASSFDILHALLQYSGPELGDVAFQPRAAVGRAASESASTGAVRCDISVLGALRQSHWVAFGRRPSAALDALGWTGEACAVVQQAVTMARAEGLTWAGRRHLCGARVAERPRMACPPVYVPDRFRRQVATRLWVDIDLLNRAAQRAWPDAREERRPDGMVVFLSPWRMIGP